MRQRDDSARSWTTCFTSAPKDALRKLVQQRTLTRQKVAGQFLYCAADRTRILKHLDYRLRVNHNVAANRGFVVVGTCHDTPDFAADNLVRWWQRDGLERYCDASELLVLADSGGSNAPRIRCFKYALQTRLADPHHLKVNWSTRNTRRASKYPTLSSLPSPLNLIRSNRCATTPSVLGPERGQSSS